MNTLKIKKAISVVLLFTFLVQNVVWANPDISEYNAHESYAREYLAPGAFDTELFSDAAAVMGFVKIGKQFFDKVDKAVEKNESRSEEIINDLVKSEVIKSVTSPDILPAEIRNNINRKTIRFDDNRLVLEYTKNKKNFIIYLSAVDPDNSKSMDIRNEDMAIDGILIQFRSADDTGIKTSHAEEKPKQEGAGEDDVTLASEGDIVVHEGAKKEIFKKHKSGRLKPVVNIIGKLFHIHRSWSLTGEYGVNDVIRPFWAGSGQSDEGRMYKAPDMPEIMAELNRTPVGQRAAYSIEENNYNVYVYNVGRRDFAGGVTTHAGIRTGNIHITREEYERLKKKGAVYLAARIAHEVTEIDLWRQKAEDLGIEIGKAQAIYNDKWATGIRKWIRDNFIYDNGNDAKRFGQIFHNRGLEAEIRIINNSILMLSKDKGVIDFHTDLLEASKKFLPGGELYNVTLKPESVDESIYKSPSRKDFTYLLGPLLSAIRHFSKHEDRMKLLNALNARAYFEVMKAEILRDKSSSDNWAIKNEEKYIYDKVKKFKVFLDEIDAIDRSLREDIEKWLSRLNADITYYTPDWKKAIESYTAVMKETVFEKSMWQEAYTGDPNDILLAAAAPYGGADKSRKAKRSKRPVIYFRDIGSDELANSIRPQGRGFAGIKELDDILGSLHRHSNWYDQYIRRKVSTSTGKGSSSVGEKVSYRHISRFTDEHLYHNRIEKLVKGLRYYISDNPSTIFNQTRVSRVYIGSRSGYFDVKDLGRETYDHTLDVVVLVDGSAKEKPFDLSSEEEIEKYFPELTPDVKRVKVRVIGLEDLKAAMRGEVVVSQKLKDELAKNGVKKITVATYKAVQANKIDLHPTLKKELLLAFRERANLQGQMIKIYREYIQVAGTDLVSSSSMPQFSRELKAFEDPYINDLILYLENQSAIIRELNEDINSLTIEVRRMENPNNISDKTRDQRDKIAEIIKKLNQASLQFKTLFTATGIKGAATELQSDIAELGRILKAVNENTGDPKYKEAYQRWEAKNKVFENIKRLLDEKKQIEAEITNINKKLSYELEQLKNKLREKEIDLAEAERDYELKCKRIEDAQVGRSLAKGVIIDDRYRIEGTLGQGGFGAVYRVEDLQTDRELAIKIMETNVGAMTNEDAKRFFEREIKNLKRFGEEGAPVPSLVDRGIYAGSNYFVMSLEKGLTLTEIIKGLKRGTIRLSLSDKVALMYAIAETLAKFHQIGAIHRDFKPDQIIIPVDKDDILRVPDPERDPGKFQVWKEKIKIIDLGTAVKGQRKGNNYWDFEDNKDERSSLTRASVILGTPHYIAPELISPSSSNKPGSKVDVYAMGCMFFEILALIKPLGEGVPDPNQILFLHSTQDPDYVRNSVKEINKKIVSEKDKRKIVLREDLEDIRDGITKQLIDKGLVTPTQEKDKLEWSFDQFNDERDLREKLEEISGLTPEHIDRVVTLAMPLAPRPDGEIEALVDRMLQKGQAERPSSRQTADELKKWLSHQMDDMIYRPHDEIPAKKSWGVIAGQYMERNWKGVLVGAFALFIGIISSIWLYARSRINKALERENIASEVEKRANEREAAATDTIKKAEERVAKAERREQEATEKERKAKEKVKALEKEREAIVAQVSSLKTESSEDLKKQDSLRKAIKGVVDGLKKEKTDLEQEKAALLKEKERLAKAINLAKVEREKAIKEAEDIRKEVKDLKEETAAMRERLEKFRESLAGIFEEAKENAKKLELNNILKAVGRIPWGGLDNEATLKKLNLGFDEVIKILIDSGEFRQAILVEQQRQFTLNNKLSNKMKAEASRYLLESDITIAKIKMMDGNYARAIRDIRRLMKDKENKSSNERMDLLRRILIEMLVEEAYLDSSKADANLEEAEDLRDLLTSDADQYLYLSEIYLAQNEHKSASKAYYYYYNYMVKTLKNKLEDKEIDADVEKVMKEKISYGLLMSAVAYLDQAEKLKKQGNLEGVKDAISNALKAVGNWERAGVKNDDHKAWIFFINAEILRLSNKVAASQAAYEDARNLAQNNGQKPLLILVYHRLGKSIMFKEMSNTWTMLNPDKVPLPFRAMIRKLLKNVSEKYQKKVRAKNGAMLRIKDRGTLVAKLAETNRKIRGLSNRLRIEGNRINKALKADITKQIESLKVKRDLLRGVAKNWPKQTGHQNPISDAGINSPDHRLVNAVIKVAIEEGLVEQKKIKDIEVNILGEEGVGNFQELYDSLSEDAKAKVVVEFDKLFENEDISALEVVDLYNVNRAKLVNMTSHAGVETSRIFISKGALEQDENLFDDKLVRHELIEMVIHQTEAARQAGYTSWVEIPAYKRRLAIQEMRDNSESDDYYNEFSVKAHEVASQLSDAGMVAEAHVLDSLVSGAAEGAGIAQEEDIKTVTEHKKQGEEEGIILFADEMVDNCAVLDLQQVAKMTGQEGYVVDKFVLFAEDGRKADILKNIIISANSKANVVIITKSELVDFYKSKGMAFEMSSVKDIERYCLNQSIFERPESVLGIVRGPVKDEEALENLRRELKGSGKRIPVVVFESSTTKGAYSLVQALAQLIKADRDDSDNLLIILPPVQRQDLQDKVLEYRALVHALQSA